MPPVPRKIHDGGLQIYKKLANRLIELNTNLRLKLTLAANYWLSSYNNSKFSQLDQKIIALKRIKNTISTPIKINSISTEICSPDSTWAIIMLLSSFFSISDILALTSNK